jgi:hypothetical protein
MNEKFKERLEEATDVKIPVILNILQSHYQQIPSHLKGTFNQLTNEFFNQPNNFSLGGWKAKFLVLIGQFKFEIQEYNQHLQKEPDKFLTPPPFPALVTLIPQQGQEIGNVLQNTSKPNYEAFKQELLAILAEKAHLGIVDILGKIEKTLAYEQYNRTDWVSINSKKSPIALEILSATLVESTKGLINSIKS